MSASVRTGARLAAVAALALTLGGCALMGLLGGGGKPPQLYRFGGADTAVSGPVAAGALNIYLSNLRMDPAAEGDRLLALTGTEASYIAQSRWVAPAQDLMIAAAERAFDRVGLRLVRRGQPIGPDLSLTLEVPTFEARYENGGDAAPVVVVEMRAALVSGTAREVIGEYATTVRQPAGANRVGAIVAAYDQAVRQALDQTAGWAATAVRSAPARTPPARP